MNLNQKKLLREHVALWERLGPELDAQRRSELRKVDSIEAIMQLMPAFDLAAQLPPRPSSGLVEQQRIFQMLHNKNMTDVFCAALKEVSNSTPCTILFP